MQIRGDGPRIPKSIETKKSAETKATSDVGASAQARDISKPSDGFTSAKSQPASSRVFPRTGWGDKKALQGEVKRAKTAMAQAQRLRNPRMKNLTKRLGVKLRDGAKFKPVMGMKYGAPTSIGQTPNKPTPEPIMGMKYGAPTLGPKPDKPTPDPIMSMKYGAPTLGPKPDKPTPDPIMSMKYGAPTLGPNAGFKPEEPVLSMKYGAPTFKANI